MSGRQSHVLVAGAGGVLGRLVVDELFKRGHRVRAVVRRQSSAAKMPRDERIEVRVLDGRSPDAWRGVCDGVDRVFSSVGASVSPSLFVRGRTYTKIDAPVNIALIEEARRAGVKRLVYVSLIHGDTTRWMDYSEGHERVVDALKSGGPAATVLRPTGFFDAMGAFQDMARSPGIIPVFGDGTARTNPIHQADLAAAAADALEDDSPGLREIALGGPDTLTRRRIAELAFESLGKKPRTVPMPAWLARLNAAIIGIANPRMAHFLRFAAHVTTHDCVGPASGTRRLGTFFKDRARRAADPSGCMPPGQEDGKEPGPLLKSVPEPSDSPRHRTFPENRP